jgi:cell wall-associated NlpC family hydrolase
VGLDYLLGGSGPAYDCSGLTQASWATQGIYLSHSSRSQYTQTTRISYSQLRPGDLIFWSSDGENPSLIYHVAMYIGGGKVVEAARPGVLSRVRYYDDWNTQNLMPYAGRP